MYGRLLNSDGKKGNGMTFSTMSEGGLDNSHQPRFNNYLRQSRHRKDEYMAPPCSKDGCKGKHHQLLHTGTNTETISCTSLSSLTVRPRAKVTMEVSTQTPLDWNREKSPQENNTSALDSASNVLQSYEKKARKGRRHRKNPSPEIKMNTRNDKTSAHNETVLEISGKDVVLGDNSVPSKVRVETTAPDNKPQSLKRLHHLKTAMRKDPILHTRYNTALGLPADSRMPPQSPTGESFQESFIRRWRAAQNVIK
jgi:hypothetical protein